MDRLSLDSSTDGEEIRMKTYNENPSSPLHDPTWQSEPFKVEHGDDSDDDNSDRDEGRTGLLSGTQGRVKKQERLVKPVGKLWHDVKGIVIESAPALILTTISLVLAGRFLNEVSQWKALQDVDELIMLIPVILNLKGNLEMNLSARMGTAANVGQLDEPKTRRSFILGNIALLQVQATVVSFIAACVSLVIGLLIPNSFPSSNTSSDTTASIIANATDIVLRQLASNSTIPDGTPLGIAYPGTQRKSGFLTFIMVASASIASTSLSSLILGSFMCFLVVICRKLNLDPDNIAPAMASCLGDLVTLCIIGLVSVWLVPFISTPLPFIIGIVFVTGTVISLIFTLRNPHVRPLLKEGWSPLMGAMVISTGTGIVLDMFVSRYEGFAILAVVISGLPGAAGSIFVSRLSTALHATELSRAPLNAPHAPSGPSPGMVISTLLVVSLPIEIGFLSFTHAIGWLELPFIFISLCVIAFCTVVLASLYIAQVLTNFLWSKGRDPDMYALPIQSALVDLIGQLLLVICYECVTLLGVRVGRVS